MQVAQTEWLSQDKLLHFISAHDTSDVTLKVLFPYILFLSLSVPKHITLYFTMIHFNIIYLLSGQFPRVFLLKSICLFCIMKRIISDFPYKNGSIVHTNNKYKYVYSLSLHCAAHKQGQFGRKVLWKKMVVHHWFNTYKCAVHHQLLFCKHN